MKTTKMISIKNKLKKKISFHNIIITLFLTLNNKLKSILNNSLK